MTVYHQFNTLLANLRLWGRRFRQQCSCGWEAPGWFTHDDTAFHVWCEHVREAKAQEKTQ